MTKFGSAIRSSVRNMLDSEDGSGAGSGHAALSVVKSESATSPNKKVPRPMDVHVGSRIRLQRTVHGISQEKLGGSLGITFQQVQKYEKGTNRVGASRLQDIANILNVPVSFFFEGAPEQDGVGKPMPLVTPGQLFAQSTQGIRLNQSLAKLPEAHRRKVIALVHALANVPDEA